MLSSESMGSTSNFCGVQHWRSRLLRPSLCVVANNDGQAPEVCSPVSPVFLVSLSALQIIVRDNPSRRQARFMQVSVLHYAAPVDCHF